MKGAPFRDALVDEAAGVSRLAEELWVPLQEPIISRAEFGATPMWPPGG